MTNQVNVTPLITAESIQARLTELGTRIREDYAGQDLVAIGVLKGSFIFFADLVRAIGRDVRCEFLALSEYDPPSSAESGEVKILLDIEDPLENCNLLLIEDLVDTGITLRFLRQMLGARKPKSLKTCTLLWKKGGVEPQLTPDYVGFEVDRSFVVGYGIDHEGRYRELPFIGRLGRPS